jgi:hypothetical protein
MSRPPGTGGRAPQVDPGWQRLGLAFDRQLDGEAGLAHLGQQELQVRDSRLRDERGSGVGLAQDPEHPPHVGQRGAPGLLDPPDRAPGAVRAAAVEHLVGGLGLDHDDAHAVRDDVVQLTRDPCALGGHGRLGVLLALALGPLRALVEARDIEATRAHVGAEQPGEQQRHDPEEVRDQELRDGVDAGGPVGVAALAHDLGSG